jgi:hypothetical protein
MIGVNLRGSIFEEGMVLAIPGDDDKTNGEHSTFISESEGGMLGVMHPLSLHRTIENVSYYIAHVPYRVEESATTTTTTTTTSADLVIINTNNGAVIGGGLSPVPL